MRGCNDLHLIACAMRNVYGDFFFVRHDEAIGLPSLRPKLTDCVGDTCGRQGITPSHVDGLTVLRGKYANVARTLIDVEPGEDTRFCKNMTFTEVVFGWYGNTALNVTGIGAANENFLFERCRSTAKRFRINAKAPRVRRKNWKFIDMICDVVTNKATADVFAVDGFVIRGMKQHFDPAAKVTAVQLSDCTGVDVDNGTNDFTGAVAIVGNNPQPV